MKGVCPGCGAEVPADAPQEHRAACLAGLPTVAPTIDSGGPHTVERSGPVGPRSIGDYELIEEIARGGMGAVWKARQVSLNRIVAVKMILAGRFASRDEVERFRREAEAAANLRHPNIVAIHEIGEVEGQQYFSMDYVEGRNLAALVREKPLPPLLAARYVKTIAEAVHYAHQRGTLHRDLKPQNVLIDGHDQPQITDSGLAKLASNDSSLTRTGAIMGSPSYMSPEQAAGRHDLMGPHSDVYSVGAILYELLTGRPPFLAATVMATMQQVMADPPVPPRKLNPALPAELETICLKCLEKSPQLRYAAARELADDLGRFLRHEPIQARPISVARRLGQWARRHPNYFSVAAALLFLGLTCLAYGLWEQNRYLEWGTTHPGSVRAAGPLTARLHAMKRWDTRLWWLLLLSQSPFFYRRTRGLSWSQVLNGEWRGRPIVPPFSPRTILAFGILGTVAAGYALYVLMKVIEAYIWEGFPAEPAAGLVLVFTYAGAMLWRAVTEHRAGLYGHEPAERKIPVGGSSVGSVRSSLAWSIAALGLRLGKSLRRWQPTAGRRGHD